MQRRFANWSSVWNSIVIMCDLNIEKRNTNSLRAIASVGIMLTHLGNMISAENSIWLFWGNIGYLCVGLFFFYSGYNLVYSYIDKGISWKFLVDKLVKIGIPFWIGNGLYILIMKEKCSFSKALGIPVTNKVLWYLISIGTIYFIFFIIFKPIDLLERKHTLRINRSVVITIASIAVFTIYVLLYPWIAYKFEIIFDNNSRFPLALIIGMLVAIIKKAKSSSVKRFVRSNKVILFLILMISCIFFHKEFLSEKQVIIWTYNVVEILPPLLFALAANVLVVEEQIKSAVLDFMGKISLWIYVLHIVCMHIWRNNVIFIKDDNLYVVVYVLTTILAGYICSQIMDWIRNKLSS